MKTALCRLIRSFCLALALGASGPALANGNAPDTLPAQELTPRALYHFLLAEIAGARGEFELAAQLYVELARSTRDARVARRATEVAMYSRNLPLASEAARLWAAAAPDSDEARRILGGLSSTGEQNLDAIQMHLAMVLASSSERLAPNLLALPRSLARMPDREAARNIIFRLTEPYLDHPEAHVARAQASLGTGDAMTALAAAELALGQRPGWEPAVLLKAQVLQQAGAHAEALRHLETELERQPDSRTLLHARARALIGAQRFVEAREAFRQLLAADAQNPDLLFAAALLSLQLDDIAAAEGGFLAALAAGHGQPDTIRLHLGQIAESRADGTAARKWFGEITDDDLQIEATIRSARSFAREGRIDEARALLQTEADDAELVRRYVMAEAQILRDANRPNDALAVLDEALRETPDDPDLLYEAGMLEERIDRLDRMEARLRRVIALQPNQAHAYNALGYSLADRKLRLDEAEALIARALELAPNDPFILDSMGWVRFRRGDPAAALGHLERAYALRQDAEIAAHLGEVLWALARHDDARRILLEALARHADNRVLSDTVTRLGIR